MLMYYKHNLPLALLPQGIGLEAGGGKAWASSRACAAAAATAAAADCLRASALL